MDILTNKRNEIIKKSVSGIEQPPKDFNKPYNVMDGVVRGGALGGVGVVLGSHMGIALFGTAVSGAWILAPILGIGSIAYGYVTKDTE